MITDTLEAWVIHKHWSGDTSARVFFFTESYGLVPCLYKGARTLKKKAIIQPFLPFFLTMDIRGDYHYVRQLDIADSAMTLDGPSLFSALYINELLYHVLRPHDPHPTLYTIYTHTVSALPHAQTNHQLEALLRRFECEVLAACGYQISFTHEVYSQSPILPERTYQLINGEGFVLSEQGGIPGMYLIAIANEQFDDPMVLRGAK